MRWDSPVPRVAGRLSRACGPLRRQNSAPCTLIKETDPNTKRQTHHLFPGQEAAPPPSLLTHGPASSPGNTQGAGVEVSGARPSPSLIAQAKCGDCPLYNCL